MRRLASIAIALVILFIMTGCQGQGSTPANAASEKIAPLTTEEKVSDFESLYKVLEENYPFFDVNKRLNGVDWLANKEKYIEMVKNTKTDEEYFNTLDNILSDLHNGHTHMISKDGYVFFKASLEFDKEYYKPWLDEFNKPNTISRYLGNKDGAINKGASTNQTADNPRPNNVSYSILIDKKVAYLSIASLDPFNIQYDMKLIKPFLESIKDYSALIIDIRGNGGGADPYWSQNLVPMLINRHISWKTYYAYRGGEFSKPFTEKVLPWIAPRPIVEIAEENLSNTPPELMDKFKYYKESELTVIQKNPVGFKGKIYLLVDRNVYSSSEMFASFAKNTGFATLVGETTGGDGIGTDPLFYSLPESGYLMRFPIVMGLTADGSCEDEHKTVPDVQVSAEKNEDISKDAAIQYVLNLYK